MTEIKLKCQRGGDLNFHDDDDGFRDVNLKKNYCLFYGPIGRGF